MNPNWLWLIVPGTAVVVLGAGYLWLAWYFNKNMRF